MKWSLIVIFALLTACAPVQPTPPPTPTITPNTAVEPAKPDLQKVDTLLNLAHKALNKDQLLTPEGDSAFTYFTKAQAVDAQDPRAARGLERITERYLTLALQAAERRSFATARSMVGRAKIVYRSVQANNPDFTEPDFASIEQQIALLSDSKRSRMTLDNLELKNRNPGLVNRLRAFGSLAKNPDTRVVIISRNDADGRWIYQQMRKAPGEYRIRGEIKIGAPTRIELISMSPAQQTPAQ